MKVSEKTQVAFDGGSFLAKAVIVEAGDSPSYTDLVRFVRSRRIPFFFDGRGGRYVCVLTPEHGSSMLKIDLTSARCELGLYLKDLRRLRRVTSPRRMTQSQ